MPGLPAFRRHTVYQGSPAERMSCLVGDLDGDGVQEFIVSTRNPEQLHWFGRPGGGAWKPHLIDDTFPSISVGGALVDLTGSGRLDLIGATSDRGSGVYWWECPADPTERWVRRDAVRLPANRTHDLLLADIDGDGRQELYVWNQDAATLFRVPLPDDPYLTPWPGMRPVVTGVDEQALAAADVDSDGRLELIAGCSWYRLLPNGEWERHAYTREFGGVRVVAADFDGAGRPDLYVGEMGRGDWTVPHPPAQRLFLSRGDRMEELVIDSGLGAHEAQAVELDGRVGIVSKPYRALQDRGPRPAGVDALYLYLPE